MTDTNALRSIIADSGLKYKAIAEIMGLTPYALQMKIDNETEFKASEIDTLANTLGMTCSSVIPYFFARKVEFNYTFASSSKGGEEDEEQHPERNPRAPRTRRALKENRPQAVRAAQERKCQFFGRRANH